MPMTEEERRRCIILGGCTEGTTQESALAEEVLDIMKGHSFEGSWQRLAQTVARGLLERGFFKVEKGPAAKETTGRGEGL